MRKIPTTAAIAASFLLHAPAQAAHIGVPSYVPTPQEIPGWVSGLKCSDLIAPGAKLKPNSATLLPFSLWLHGYLSGVASTLPLGRLPAKQFDFFRWMDLTQFDALVLTACHMHPNSSAVETAIDAASMMIDLVSKAPVKLRGTDGKWE